jgi:hypothetical protein
MRRPELLAEDLPGFWRSYKPGDRRCNPAFLADYNTRFPSRNKKVLDRQLRPGDDLDCRLR